MTLALGPRFYLFSRCYDDLIYSLRAGFWRLHRLFSRKRQPCTVFACMFLQYTVSVTSVVTTFAAGGMALQRNPDVAKAMLDAEWEIASHGYFLGVSIISVYFCWHAVIAG